MEEKKIINYEELEVAMLKIEDILQDYDGTEQSLLITCIRERQRDKVTKQKLSDSVNNTVRDTIGKHPSLKMLGKFFGNEGEQ